MTREEARLKLLEATDGRCTERFISDFLESSVALGMLKLDEPKSKTAQLAIAIRWPAGSRSEAELIDALSNTGLKLTGK